MKLLRVSILLAVTSAACGGGAPAGTAGAGTSAPERRPRVPPDPTTAAATTDAALAVAFGLPRVVAAGVMASRSAVTESVYFASGQTGSLLLGQPTKTGTITVTQSGSQYSPSPADRLIVRLGAAVHEFVNIDAEGGGQAPTASGWLAAPHRLSYLHRMPGQAEATITESFDGRTFDSRITGWTTIQGQRYDIDLTSRGQTAGVRENDGRETQTTYELSGTIRGGAVDLDVHEQHSEQFASTYSLALLYSQRGYASQFRAAMTSTLRTGGDTFTFSNVQVESGAKEKGGQASSGLASVSGDVLRNGRPFATCTLLDGRPVAVAGGRAISLELAPIPGAMAR